MPWVTSETPPKQSPKWPLFLRLGFQSSIKVFQPQHAPLGLVFPPLRRPKHIPRDLAQREPSIPLWVSLRPREGT